MKYWLMVAKATWDDPNMHLLLSGMVITYMTLEELANESVHKQHPPWKRVR
jgi:hypothetical protein